MDFQAGQTLLFYKPKEWTSFDVVKKVRSTIRIKKVGHAGTLDPLATGLLIICTGKHTKTINQIQEQEKVYEVTFKLGVTTASYDAEQPEENHTDTSHITQEAVEAALESFKGEIKQIPPIYSAVKVNGKRAYKAARKGQDIKLRARIVEVYDFHLIDYQNPECITAEIRCSTGTYIRSLVHDLGQQLGVGGYILELSRTRIGDHKLEDAWDLDAFAEQFKKTT